MTWKIKEVIFESPLCFGCNNKAKDDQIHTLGNNVDAFDIEALHYKVMVMLGPHVINSYLDSFQKNEALCQKVMVMFGPHLVESYLELIVQDETLHYKVMVMSGSHTTHYSYEIDYKFPMRHNFDEVSILPMNYFRASKSFKSSYMI